VIEWLTATCALRTLQPAADKVVTVSEKDGLVTEQLLLGVDRNLHCPAVLVHPAGTDTAQHTAVVLSHGDRQSAQGAKIADAARRLATAGLWVIVPDHASCEPHSLQPLGRVSKPSFRGDEAAGFYGPADAVSRPPLALRVAEDLAAVRHLVTRGEVSPTGILVAGQGIGGVDACVAAVLDERIAGVVSIDATTFRSWAKEAAPEQLHFLHIMPYLPSLLTETDLDCVYAAIAPRPLVVIRPKDSWSRAGFDQLVETAATVYELRQAEDAFRALNWRDVTPEFIAGLPDGIPKQLIAAAQPLLPTPPQPGTVGTVDGLQSRGAVDGASGLICVVAEMAGCEQEFTGGPRTLQTWRFFNDNGDAQKGRTITPLILRKQDSLYEVVAIGTPRVNAGTGAQSFAFEPVEGSASVGPGCFFGWYTGDLQRHHNAGVIEFDDAADAQMILLTADGQMVDQTVKLGAKYREQSRYRRCYSVWAGE
jgi:dienelactone hydrolase